LRQLVLLRHAASLQESFVAGCNDLRAAELTQEHVIRKL
jgi:hypothetical protein